MLADGREIPADLVVMAVGIRPNIDLARAAGLDVNRGILVDDDMRTSATRHLRGRRMRRASRRGVRPGRAALGQAKVCGARLAGDDAAVYVPPPVFTSLKVTGIDVFSAGDFAAADEHRRRDRAARRHARRLQAASCCATTGSSARVLYGNVADGAWYFQLMRDKARRLGIPRPADLRPGLRRGRPARTLPAVVVAALADGERSAAATASARARSAARSRDKGLHDARRGAGAHQGVGLLRLLHRLVEGSWRMSLAATAVERRADQADVQMHRATATTTSAARSSSRS